MRRWHDSDEYFLTRTPDLGVGQFVRRRSGPQGLT